jgi:hypothetical protein
MKNHLKVTTYLLCMMIGLASAHALNGYYEIKGTTSNVVVKNNDGLVDFSLIIPGMNYEQIINFDLGRVISPANDTLKISSYTVELPSNLSLPPQTEKYFISIKLDKPEFRAYVENTGTFDMYALNGKFPLKEMVKGFQDDKSIFELVEFFDFLGGGIQAVPVTGDVSGLNIPVNQFAFTESYSVKAPTYAKDKVMISFSLFKENDQFFPADMKKVISTKTQSLVKRAGLETWNLALLMNKSSRSFRETYDGHILSGALGSYSIDRNTSPLAQVSYTLAPASATTEPQFLPTVSAPTFDQTNLIVQASIPQTITGVFAYGTTLTLSEVEAGGSENFPIDFKKVLWTTEAMGWAKDFKIPANVKSLIQSGKVYSWDVNYLGAPTNSTDSQIEWSKVTHVTRNSLKF